MRGTEWLARIRVSPRHRALAMLVGGGLSMLLASVHWSGLVVGGVAVGLVSRTLPRALAAGLAFGVAVVAVFAVSLLSVGALDAALSMGQFSVITLVAPLVAGPLGALAHGIVPIEERPASSTTAGGDTSVPTAGSGDSEAGASEETITSTTERDDAIDGEPEPGEDGNGDGEPESDDTGVEASVPEK